MDIIRKISKEEATNFCINQENDFFDRKSARSSGAKIQETAVAFANTDGGVIVIGIEDEKTGHAGFDLWEGVGKIEDYNQIIQSIVELDPTIDFVHNFLYVDEHIKKYVLMINVLRSLRVHKTSKGEFYVRRGAQSIKIPVTKVQELMRAKGLISEEDELLPTVLPEEIVDSKYVIDYLKLLPIREKDPFGFLVQERLLFLSPKFAPTVAGVLLFSKNPSILMVGQCAVKIVRYDSAEDDIDRNSLTSDIHTVEGSLYEIIKESSNKLTEVISRVSVWSISGEGAPKYPSEALWEVLVNSVLHRDYGVSDNVLISVYRNRIEFKSPGRLPGYVTPDNILDNRFSRNPKMVRALARYPDAPNKDMGEGVNTVFEKMKRFGYIDPIISDKNNYVTVILKRIPRTDHSLLIKNFISRHGSINNRQALDILALDRSDQITNIFGKMRERGEIKKMDESTGVRVKWILDEVMLGEQYPLRID